MFKLFCVCAILAVVAAFPGGIDEPVNQDTIVKRETLTAPNVAAENNDPNAPTVETQEDMDKAETFGFGYRKYIHVYPSYYPRYYYGSYYYPRYYYGHYGHYCSKV
uniref:Uncharacterized protein n=1 Tax=Anopheles culicifacies TaxID=139723 RepID=A0A182MEX9_9DIPT